MKTEIVSLKIGINLEMQLIKVYPKGKLFFCQERLCVTDLDNKELVSNDIIDLVEAVLTYAPSELELLKAELKTAQEEINSAYRVSDEDIEDVAEFNLWLDNQIKLIKRLETQILLLKTR